MTQAATRVAEGSEEAIESLIKLISNPTNYTLSNTSSERSFLALLMYLKKREPPQSDAAYVTWSIMKKPIEFAFSGLSMIINRSKGRGQQPLARSLGALIIQFWPTLFKWLSIILQHGIDDAQEAISRRQTAKLAITAFINDCLSIHLPVKLNSLPEVTLLAMKMWILDVSEPRLHIMENRGKKMCAHSATLFYNCFVTMDDNERAIFQDAVVLNFDAPSVANVALIHLQWGSSTSDAVMLYRGRYMGDDTDVSVMDFLTYNIPIARALLLQGSIKASLKALEAGVGVIAIYLRNAFTTGNGTTWILEALNAQMLPTLLAGISQSSGGALGESIIEIFSEILPQYLIYESILVAAGRALKRVQASGMLYQTFLAGPDKILLSRFELQVEKWLCTTGRQVTAEHASEPDLTNRCDYVQVST